MNQTITITDAEMQERVLESTEPVLVDFWAPWCAPCQRVSPVLDEIASELAAKLVIAKVDVDENEAWADHLHVQSIPTLVLFRGGQEIDRLVGGPPKAELAAWLEARLSDG